MSAFVKKYPAISLLLLAMIFGFAPALAVSAGLLPPAWIQLGDLVHVILELHVRNLGRDHLPGEEAADPIAGDVEHIASGMRHNLRAENLEQQ